MGSATPVQVLLGCVRKSPEKEPKNRALSSVAPWPLFTPTLMSLSDGSQTVR